MKLTSLLCSVLAGGLLFGSAFSSADRNAPPAPPAAPGAPKAPKAPKAPGKGIHVQIDGLDEMIDVHIKDALDTVSRDPNVPAAVREKITKRLEGLRKKIRARVGNGSNLDPEELGELGEELGREMEEFGREMEQWGEQFGEDMENKFGNFDVTIGVGHGAGHGPGHDDGDDDDRRPPTADDDPDDIDDVRDMSKLNLKPGQRDQIKKLRTESDAKVTTAQRELDRASETLRKQLENPGTSDADISRAIDNVAQQEAAIRKARILAWVNARRILDDAQRKKVEGAAKRQGK